VSSGRESVVRVAGVVVDPQQQRDVLEAYQGSEPRAPVASSAIAARVELIIEAAIPRVGCQRWPFG
jgi:hypothetical protein